MYTIENQFTNDGLQPCQLDWRSHQGHML